MVPGHVDVLDDDVVVGGLAERDRDRSLRERLRCRGVAERLGCSALQHRPGSGTAVCSAGRSAPVRGSTVTATASGPPRRRTAAVLTGRGADADAVDPGAVRGPLVRDPPAVLVVEDDVPAGDVRVVHAEIGVGAASDPESAPRLRRRARRRRTARSAPGPRLRPRPGRRGTRGTREGVRCCAAHQEASPRIVAPRTVARKVRRARVVRDQRGTLRVGGQEEATVPAGGHALAGTGGAVAGAGLDEPLRRGAVRGTEPARRPVDRELHGGRRTRGVGAALIRLQVRLRCRGDRGAARALVEEVVQLRLLLAPPGRERRIGELVGAQRGSR